MGLRGGQSTTGVKEKQSQVLITKFGESCFALPVEIIRGTLPRKAEHLPEQISAYGMDFPLMNLTSKTGMNPSDRPTDPRIVLCMRGNERGAIPVDAVLGLTKLKSSEVQPLPRHFTGAERSWFPGHFLYADGVALLVNPQWLLSQS